MQSNPASSSPDQNRSVGPSRTTEIGVMDSDKLFGGRTEIRVLHRGEEYRLRITRQGKLILTK